MTVMAEDSLTAAAQSGEGAGTSLQVSPLTDSARIARFIAFLHRDAGAPRVDLEPHQGQEYLFEVSVPPSRIIEALLDSPDFRPRSLRSFAEGRLQVRLSGSEPATAAETRTAPPAGAVPPRAPASNRAPPNSDGEAARRQAPPTTAIAMPSSNHVTMPEAAPESETLPVAEDQQQIVDALKRLSHVLDESLDAVAAPAGAASYEPEEAPAVEEAPVTAASPAAEERSGPDAAETKVAAEERFEPDVAETETPAAVTPPVPAAPEEERRQPVAEAPIFLRASDGEADEAAGAFAAEAPRAERETEAEVPAETASAAGSAAEAGVQLIARPFSNFGQLNRFITVIGALADVRSVTLRRFRDGTLALAVDCADAAAFGSRLRTQREIPVEVLSEGDGTIEVTVQEESRQTVSA